MSRPIFPSPEAAARLLTAHQEPAGAARANRGADDELRGRQPRAVRHALGVLECVAQAGAGTTAREIAATLGLSRAATYRLVQLLVEDEYLVRLPDLSGFALGRRVASLAPPAAPRPPRAARDVLSRLRSGLRGGIHLVRLDGAVPVVADEDPDFPLATGPGLSPVLDGVCAELAAGAGSSLHTGEAWTAVAVAVLDEEGQLVAALVVLGPTDRLPDPADTAGRLGTAAAELGPLLA